MKVINVSLTVQPGKQADYEAFVAKLVAGSLAEAGNLDYGHFKKIGSDNEYEIVEHWKDADAVESHNNTPHFQEFLNHIGDYVTKDPEIIRMDN
ncbi:putative quinol monooxygenase [Companilactobacillus sp.]|uniref:putative quinol monooxygenase n=1 Tax=Companilactobacillus sp. TaxID=2767905 RepID=UPI00262CC9D4|nr:putative quinol monooxygenase [Companilactobacillus sp.]